LNWLWACGKLNYYDINFEAVWYVVSVRVHSVLPGANLQMGPGTAAVHHLSRCCCRKARSGIEDSIWPSVFSVLRSKNSFSQMKSPII